MQSFFMRAARYCLDYLALQGSSNRLVYERIRVLHTSTRDKNSILSRAVAVYDIVRIEHGIISMRSSSFYSVMFLEPLRYVLVGVSETVSCFLSCSESVTPVRIRWCTRYVIL